MLRARYYRSLYQKFRKIQVVFYTINFTEFIHKCRFSLISFWKLVSFRFVHNKVEPFDLFSDTTLFILKFVLITWKKDFQKSKIVPQEGYFEKVDMDIDPNGVKWKRITQEEFAEGLKKAMQAEEDKPARFGALAPGLGGEHSCRALSQI